MRMYEMIVWPQYLAEPQHAEVYFEEMWTV